MRTLTAALAAATVLATPFARALENAEVAAALPDSTAFAVHVRLDTLRKAPALERLRALMPIEQRQDMLNRIQDACGIDFEKVTDIWLAGARRGEGALVLQGQFDAEAIRTAFLGNEEARAELLELPGAPLSFLFTPQRWHGRKAGGRGADRQMAAVLDAHTAAAGQKEFVEAFLSAARTGGGGLAPVKAAKAAALAAAPRAIEAALFAVPDEVAAQKPFLKSVKSASMSLDAGEALRACLSVETSSPEQAAALEQVASGFASLARLNPPDDTARRMAREAFLNGLKMSRSGATFTISCEIDPDEIARLADAAAQACGPRGGAEKPDAE